jgi:dipeptidase E
MSTISASSSDRDQRNLLLLSNSRNAGAPFLGHAVDWIADTCRSAEDILLVPYAVPAVSDAVADAAAFFERRGMRTVIAEEDRNAQDQVKAAGSIFILGGNTFRLLRHLYDRSLLEPLTEAAFAGVPFMGASAGCNVACPTLSTTNDMPMVEPPSFRALALIPFQINTHYVEDEYRDDYTGESRRQRLEEFVAEVRRPVLGLREGTAVRVVGGDYTLVGERNAQLFQVEGPSTEVVPGPLGAEVLGTLGVPGG